MAWSALKVSVRYGLVGGSIYWLSRENFFSTNAHETRKAYENLRETSQQLLQEMNVIEVTQQLGADQVMDNVKEWKGKATEWRTGLGPKWNNLVLKSCSVVADGPQTIKQHVSEGLSALNSSEKSDEGEGKNEKEDLKEKDEEASKNKDEAVVKK